MVSQISFGNISQQNGRTVVTGSSSGGLDTQALIEGLSEARRLPAVQLEQRIEENTALQSAYQNMREVLNRFRDAANFLRSPPGVLNQADNIFEYRSATVGGNTSGAAGNYVSVTAEPGASISNYDLTIDQLASFNTKITNTFSLADADTDAVGAGLPFNAGNLQLGANGTSVTIDADDTLNQVVAKINAVKNNSKVEASILKVADGQFRLVLKTTETGSDLNYGYQIPPPPSFVTNEAIFRLDANDINGNGNYADNPGVDQAVPAPTDATGSVVINTNGGVPALDVDGSGNGGPTFTFDGTRAYAPGASVDLVGSTTPQKTFAFSFRTSANVTGVQTIYEQGGGSIGYGVYIAPDPANGNQPTLFANVYNNTDWDAPNQLKTLNLGAANGNTDYNIVLDFDASANPAAHDVNNIFTGYVNGQRMDQETGLEQQYSHIGGIGIGGTVANSTLPDGMAFGGDGNYFTGSISEVIQLNRSLSESERTELNTYLAAKYNEPIYDGSVFNVGFAVEEAGLDSQVTIDGTSITRSTNSIDDVVDGLTFNLLAETAAGEELNVNIKPDTELAKSAIINFVDSYNEFRIFAARQSETNDDGTPTDDALLASSSTLRTALGRVNAEVASVVDGIANGNFDRLADIGLNFSDFPGDEETPFVRNTITVDEAKLDSALSANFDQVRDLFEFDFTTDDPELTVFSRTNALDVSSVQLNIDQTNGIYQATYTDAQSVVQTIDLDVSPLSGGTGVFLSGRADTVLEGLTLIFTSADDSIVNLTLTQGIADRLYNTLDEMLTEDNGLLTVELESISDDNSRLEEEIARIDEIVERYREQLLIQFSALETAIAQSNLILQSLNAQNDARLASSG